jgi:putative membrane protein
MQQISPLLLAVFDALRSGVPSLLLDIFASIALLAIGVALYAAVTPFRERALVADGNVAAGIVLAGAIVSIALPITAVLATSVPLLDVLVWGCVAVFLQLLTLGVLSLFFRNLRTAIEGGNIAAALTIAAVQIAVALINAASMIPN